MTYVNTASRAQLASGITSSAPSVTLASYTGWPLAYPFYAIINRGTTTAEIVQVTGGAGSTLTISRALGGTLPAAHNGGEYFEHVVPAEVFTNFETHMAASTAVHGVSGSVVGTSGAQTLTDKTYRGGYTHAFADALPAGLGAGFEVTASSAIARDGFKVTNTGASDTRRAFLLEQSGTPRHEVFQDGTVKTSPNSAHTRPGQEVNTAAAKPAFRATNSSAGNATTFEVAGNGNTTVGGTLGVTGNATLSGTADVTGKTTLAGQAEMSLQPSLTATARFITRVRPTQNAWELKDEAGFNILTVGSGGNVDASGYLATASTLAVTGASTLTGDVTLPVPGAGTTTRITSKARTGGKVFEGRNQSDVATMHIKETGEIVTAGRVLAYNSTSPLMGSVSGTGVVPSPGNNHIVWDASVGVWMIYNGSTWLKLNALTAARQVSVQSIPNNTFTTVILNTADTDSHTALNTGTGVYTVPVNGLYQLGGGVSFDPNVTGQRGLRWARNGTEISGSQVLVDATGGGNATMVPSRVILVNCSAGDTLALQAFQNSGGALNSAVTTSQQPNAVIRRMG